MHERAFKQSIHKMLVYARCLGVLSETGFARDENDQNQRDVAGVEGEIIMKSLLAGWISHGRRGGVVLGVG